jgi:hypothetical protein
MLKTTLSYIVCELQTTDPQKGERLLEALQQMLSINAQGDASRHHSSLAQHMQRSQDFLLEYVLNTLLFLIQNRRSQRLVRHAIEAVTNLINSALLRPTIQCFMSNLLEVSIDS